ncbi:MULTISPECIES: hypothetical protein [unclassified Pseudofrankia]|uniref:hypothetical protein n=1 Tax=unclassified Pseudofrankia TaxID=2994372 RepID=UPI0008D8F491|nr:MULTISPECIES: hypothetical protein [unclassified Pseudofrankia]MDT3442525.1 hypothetical protein [Pseudofrankia sp. BMG5.37]OHV74692.1 hypothetical protein BCD48_31580 [Pseudofrankia sp. BMG5.36]
MEPDRRRQAVAVWPSLAAPSGRFPAGTVAVGRGVAAVAAVASAAPSPGLPKTRLAHVLAATALNLIRLDAWWTGTPLDRPRASHLARLDFGLAA